MKVPPRFKWLAVLLWVCCIWFMSAHSEPPGDPIGRITHLVQNTIVQPPILPGKFLAFSVQKLGHLWEYCVLGSLLAWALQRQRQGKWLIIPLGVVAASLDETIQRFVPGREGCFRCLHRHAGANGRCIDPGDDHQE